MHSCRSPRPTAKGCDLTPSTQTQFLRKNTIIRRAIAGPYFRKAFPEGPGRMIFRCRENMGRHLLHTPNISRKLLESENVVCNSTAATKNALGIFQLWFNYFAASFFKELGVHFSREFKERDVPVAVAFHRASLLVYRDDHSFLPIFLVTFQNTKSFGDLPVHQAT